MNTHCPNSRMSDGRTVWLPPMYRVAWKIRFVFVGPTRECNGLHMRKKIQILRHEQLWITAETKLSVSIMLDNVIQSDFIIFFPTAVIPRFCFSFEDQKFFWVHLFRRVSKFVESARGTKIDLLFGLEFFRGPWSIRYAWVPTIPLVGFGRKDDEDVVGFL